MATNTPAETVYYFSPRLIKFPPICVFMYLYLAEYKSKTTACRTSLPLSQLLLAEAVVAVEAVVLVVVVALWLLRRILLRTLLLLLLLFEL